MSDGKTKGQLLTELLEAQSMLERKVAAQDRLIQRFRLLVDNEGLFTQVIYYFPYPIVLFSGDGELKLANQAFYNETNRSQADVAEGGINILARLTNENYEMLDAFRDVFAGETRALRKLKDPLSMFISDKENVAPTDYGSAIFFPLIEDDGHIRLGAAMFMK